MARELTPDEEMMDTNKDGRVSRKERREFRRQAPETVAGKWGIAYALITQLRESPDPDARSFVRWFDGKVNEYRSNPTGFSDEAFTIEFNQQPWAQKNKSSVIEDMNFEAQFPDLYRQQLDAEVEVLRDEAVQFGAAVTDDDLRELAKQKRRFGLNESQMRNSLSNLATVKGGALAGQAGSLQAGLKDWARRNGVALTDNSINNYVRRIQSGDTTEADVLQDLRRTYLAGAYPGWADRIEAGQDIADIAEPYRQTMARILELPEDQVDLNDSLLRRGLQSVGPDGKPRVMPLYEFEQEIRKDPRWEFTENAYDVYSRVGTNLLRTFGFR